MKAKTNVMIALKNILDYNDSELVPVFESNGSKNKAGDNLEFFVKDAFCGESFGHQYLEKKNEIYSKYLSWTGDSSHFPDMIVKGGVGVESKKMNASSHSTVALNSSYPKDFISANTQNYPTKSLENEPDKNFASKPVIYAIGNVNPKNNRLETLWFVYGHLMVPNGSFYLNIINKTKKALKNINSAFKSEKSNELGRANGLDRLKNSNMRIRGMYELVHPSRVFDKYINDVPKNGKSKIVVAIPADQLEAIKKDMGSAWTPLQQSLKAYEAKGKLFKIQKKLPDPNDEDGSLDAIFYVAFTD